MPGSRAKGKGRYRSKFKPEMLSKSICSTFNNGIFNNVGHDMLSIGRDMVSVVIQIGDMKIPGKTCIEISPCLHVHGQQTNTTNEPDCTFTAHISCRQCKPQRHMGYACQQAEGGKEHANESVQHSTGDPCPINHRSLGCRYKQGILSDFGIGQRSTLGEQSEALPEESTRPCNLRRHGLDNKHRLRPFLVSDAGHKDKRRPKRRTVVMSRRRK